jgi:hypothetical protein
MPQRDRVELAMLLQSPKGHRRASFPAIVLWLPLVKSGRNQRLLDQTVDGVKDLSIVGALFARDMSRSLKAEMFDKPSNSSEDNSLHTRQ